MRTEDRDETDDSDHDAEAGRSTNCLHHYIVDISEVHGVFEG